MICNRRDWRNNEGITLSIDEAIMTMTVKLDAALEMDLRQRSAARGQSASALIREALTLYLESSPAPTRSAYEAGQHLFGKYRGPEDLSARRKDLFAEVLTDNRRRRKAEPERG